MNEELPREYVDTDVDEAEAHYRYNENAGESDLRMGLRYSRGAGVPVDHMRAQEHFQRAADQGIAPAKAKLARMALDRHGSFAEVNETEANATAVQLFQEASDLGSDYASSHLGWIYMQGLSGARKNVSRAMDYFEKAVRNGNTDAAYNLGLVYYHNFENVLPGGPNFTKAYELFVSAQNENHLIATFNVAVMHYYNQGFYANNLTNDERFKRASEGFQKVMLHGDHQACALETSLADALVVQQAWKRALLHYELAAEMGEANAMLNVEWIYQRHMNDPVKAWFWAKRRNEVLPRDLSVWVRLGDYEWNGYGVIGNKEEARSRAFQWWSKAEEIEAENETVSTVIGNRAHGLWNVAWCLETGHCGKVQDLDRARDVYWQVWSAETGTVFAAVVGLISVTIKQVTAAVLSNLTG
eukprot:TRINITY_DN3287_c0_g2_i1.p1 TRINITY_DN3287_c0_g2~~TRINITY_DN3287_c0_g2_i1.p1  ORF type:complete len:453 (-),score=65.34 TRINITY_DN3287_c0_g2_i1:36-1274(-)